MVDIPAPRARRCRRRKIGPETWSAVAAFISREGTVLQATSPGSPRIRPTLPRIRFLEGAL
jgi:hypothetical protein